MTDYPINIRFDTTQAEAGARRVDRSLESIETAGRDAAFALDLINQNLRRIDARSVQSSNLQLSAMERQTQALTRSLTRYRSQLRTTNTETRRIRQENRRTARSFGEIQSSLRGVGTALGVGVSGFTAFRAASFVVDQARDFQNLERRVLAVSDGTRELRSNIAGLNRVSDATGSLVENNARSFQRLTLATSRLGLTSNDTLSILQTLNQGFQVGGASVEEQRSAILQLTQALASGTLQGDELRSLRESAPLLLQAIADGAGVAVGELKQLGAEGRLTSELIVRGLQRAAPQLQQEFDRLPRTFDQTVTRLENSATRLGEAFQPTLRVYQNAIESTRELIDEAARAATVLTGSGILRAAEQRANAGGSREEQRQRVARRIQPEIGIDIAQRTERLGLSATDLDQLINRARGATENTTETLREFIEDEIRFRREAIRIVDSGLLESAEVPQAALQSTSDRVRQSAEEFQAEIEAITQQNREQQIRSVETLIRSVEENNLDPFIRAPVVRGLREQGDEVAAGTERVLSQLSSFRDQARSLLGEATKLFVETAQAGLERLESGRQVSQVLGALRQEAEALRQTNAQRRAAAEIKRAEAEAGRDLTESERQSIQAAAQSLEVESRKVEILQDVRGSTDEYRVSLQALNELLEAGSITQGQYSAALSAAREANEGGIESNRRVAESIRQIGIEAEQTTGALGELAAASTRPGTLGGQFALGNLDVKGPAAALDPNDSQFARILGSFIGVGTRAGGGPTARRRPVVVNERGPEIFAPAGHPASSALLAATAGRRHSGFSSAGGAITRAGGGPVDPFLIPGGPQLFNPPSAGTIIPAEQSARFLQQPQQQAPNVTVMVPAPNVTVENVIDAAGIVSRGLEDPKNEQRVVRHVSDNADAI